MKGVRKEAAAFLWLEALGTQPGYDPSVLSRQVLRKCSAEAMTLESGGRGGVGDFRDRVGLTWAENLIVSYTSNFP